MQEMTREEIGQALAASRLGVLSLARGNRAYAFPLFYGYLEGTFFFHSHPGKKDEFIHATEEACLTVVRAITEDDWQSVMAFGHVERVRLADEIKLAMDALMSIPAPPELGNSEAGEPRRSMEDVHVWKLTPHRMTGRKSLRPIDA